MENKNYNESRYWLSLLKDAGLAESLKVEQLLSEVDELSSMLASGILRLKSKL